jgi:signal transduction histidine kinase
MVALGQMSQEFVHDFRNILAVIAAGLNLAKRHESDAALLDSFLAGAQEGVERGLRMTMRLLDFASGHDCEIHAENVNDALQRLQTLLRFAVRPDIRIAMQFDPDVPDLDFDTSQFNAAIMNLVVNARDAMPDGGVIQISTAVVVRSASPGRKSISYVRVRVRDDGLGMSADVRSRILDLFFTTKGGLGTGLGVPQVENFVRQIGGFMTIDSAIGLGSTFDLFFPYDAVPTVTASPCFSTSGPEAG